MKKKLPLFGFLLLGICMLFSISVLLAQAPNISYPANNNYSVGQTITPITPSNSGGAVPAKAYALTTTFAGGTQGYANGNSGANSTFHAPFGLVVDHTNTYAYICDTYNQMIRRVTISTGATITLAGSPTAGSGTTNGTTGSTTLFNSPRNIAIDPSNTYIYVADGDNSLIRQVTIATGATTTLAGVGQGSANGTTGATSSFNIPYAVAVDPTNTYVYVADFGNNLIRRVTIATGLTITVAGSSTNSQGSSNGAGSNASFHNPIGIVIDPTNTFLYVADANNNLIRKITIATGVVSTLAGSPSNASGSVNGTSGSTSSFNYPSGVFIDPTNTYVYVGDAVNNMVRIVSIATGAVSTLVGATTSGRSNGTGTAARFSRPAGLGMDASGNLFLADQYNDLLRTVQLFGYSAISPALPAGLSFDPTTGIISGTPTATSPSTTYTTTAYNATGFSTGTTNIAVAQVLPVTLARFTATANGCTANLAWQTGSESNNSYYGVEYGTDGSSFNQVAEVPSQNSATGATYGAAYAMGSGSNFFRLKTVDKGGQLSYSNVVAVTGTGACSASQQITIWPNPTSDRISIHGLFFGNIISLYSMNGQKLLGAVANDSNQSIEMGSFAQGVYMLRIQAADGGISNIKVIKK